MLLFLVVKWTVLSVFFLLSNNIDLISTVNSYHASFFYTLFQQKYDEDFLKNMCTEKKIKF